MLRRCLVEGILKELNHTIVSSGVGEGLMKDPDYFT